MNFFCSFFLIFDKKYRPIITYRWRYFIYCFQSSFSQKKSVLLKLPNLITLLSRLDQSNKIHFAVSWWVLIVKRRSNTLLKEEVTLCSNDISFNFTLISTTGEGKYDNEVISVLLSFSNNFSRDNYHI